MPAPSQNTITRDIYTVDYDQQLPGGVPFMTRMTIIRLESGGLWLHSPVPINDALARAVETLGRVQYLVAPNLFHHFYMPAAMERWPEAELWVPAGMAEKVPELAAGKLLAAADADGGEAPAWAAEIDSLAVTGAEKINERIFLHRETGTLVVTDLLFNWGRARGFWQRIIFAIMGVNNGLRQSRAWRMVASDRAAAADSLKPLADWPVRRLIPCHGTVIDSIDAATVVRAINRFG